MDELAIAIVGTRNVTKYGKQITVDTATYLAGSGVTVVSGLARGVDGIAHRAALEAGGRTIAVLGSGVDVIYPPNIANLLWISSKWRGRERLSTWHETGRNQLPAQESHHFRVVTRNGCR